MRRPVLVPPLDGQISCERDAGYPPSDQLQNSRFNKPIYQACIHRPPRRLVWVRIFACFMLSFVNVDSNNFNSKELQRLGVPLYCPWNINPYEQPGLAHANAWDYRTPLVHALGVSSRGYISWLLRHGGASIAERLNGTQTILHNVMASGCMASIAFFFRGCESHEEGAAFLPSKYREDEGTEVISLFFEANCDTNNPEPIELAPFIKRVGRASITGRMPDAWHNSRLGSYLYLLHTYPHAKIPIEAPFFRALGTLFRPTGLSVEQPDNGSTRSSEERETERTTLNNMLEKVRIDHAQRRPRLQGDRIARGRDEQRSYRKSIWDYLRGAPADGLSGKDLLLARSLIPPGVLPQRSSSLLQEFSPGIQWASSSFALLTTSSWVLLMLILWGFRQVPLSELDARSNAAFIRATWLSWLVSLLWFSLSLIATVFVDILWSLTVAGVVVEAFVPIYYVEQLVLLLKFSGSVDWRYLALAASMLVPTAASVTLAVLGVSVGLDVKRYYDGNGYLLFPYVV